jgi:predicted nucleotidyltransferase
MVGATMDSMAFLSVRMPQSVRNRVKAVAAQRGERLHDLVAGLIERFPEEAERHPPELGDVLHRLRGLEPRLRASGVAALWVFGSVARGDAQPDSDVDLVIDFAPDAKASLFQLVRIKEEIEQALERPVDIGERSAMTKHVVTIAERDLVRVF